MTKRNVLAGILVLVAAIITTALITAMLLAGWNPYVAHALGFAICAALSGGLAVWWFHDGQKRT